MTKTIHLLLSDYIICPQNGREGALFRGGGVAYFKFRPIRRVLIRGQGVLI